MSEDAVRILIVGGSPEEREKYKGILGEAPEFEYVFSEAESCEEGLERYRIDGPDCVLLDCSLSDLDPAEFLDSMADASGQLTTSVVALVAKGKASAAQKALDAGALDYFMKDQLEPAVFARVVRYAVEATWSERNLDELRVLFKTVLTTLPGFLVFKNRELVYTAMNPAFCKFIGRSPDEVMGKTDTDLYPESEADAYRNADNEVMTSGIMQTDEEEVTCPRGKRLLQVRRSPIVDSDGLTVGILWTARDVTKAQEGGEDLLEKGVKEAGEETSAKVECEFQPSYRLSVVNEAFCDVTGKPEEELVGQSIRVLIPPEELDSLNEALAVLTVDRPTGKCRHGLLLANGETQHFEWTHRATFNKRGRLEAFHGVGRPASGAGDDDEMKECPECAEMIRGRAKRCRFCGYQIED